MVADDRDLDPRQDSDAGGAEYGLPRRETLGTPPGTIVVDPQAPQPQLTLIAYGPDQLVEHTLQQPQEVRSFLDQMPVVWLNVDGLGDAAVLLEIAGIFGVHLLTLEDIVNVHQRPKVDEYEDMLFIVTRMVHDEPSLWTEQVSMLLGRGWLVTFQEQQGDCLDGIRNRLRQKRGRIRGSGADYLAYAVFDAILDGHFPVLEAFGEALDQLEDESIENPQRATVSRLHRVKMDLLVLRRAIWPQRDVVNKLLRDTTEFIGPDTRLYLRDSYDHAVRLIDLLEHYRETSASLMELYATNVGNRMNEVMKVLTIIATIFIPLTFLAGVYGMNFKVMPELDWPWAYPAVWVVMIAIAAGMLFWFRRKGWFD